MEPIISHQCAYEIRVESEQARRYSTWAIQFEQYMNITSSVYMAQFWQII